MLNVPLCLISGIQDYDEAYRKNPDCAGLHISRPDDPSLNVDWRRLPQPYVIDIAARRDPEYKSYYDYQVLMEVKQAADEAIETYHFLYLDDEIKDCYTLRNVEKMPENLDVFTEKAGELLDEDLEAEITEDLLMESGFTFDKVRLTMAEHDLIATDREGKQSVVQVGDLYKLISMSMRYMWLLEKNLKIYHEVYEAFSRVRNEKQAKVVYTRNLNAFINALKAGLIIENSPSIWSYKTRNMTEVLLDLRRESSFDREHYIYHLFREFCKLDHRVIAAIRTEAREIITGEEKLPELQGKIKGLIAPNGVSNLLSEETVNESVNGSRLDYTFAYDPQKEGTVSQILFRFYKTLQRNL